MGQECCSLLFPYPRSHAETLSGHHRLCAGFSTFDAIYCSLTRTLSLPDLCISPFLLPTYPFSLSRFLSSSLSHTPDGIPSSADTSPSCVFRLFLSHWHESQPLLVRSSFSDTRGRSLKHFNLHYARPRIAEGSIKFLLSEAAFSVHRPDQA